MGWLRDFGKAGLLGLVLALGGIQAGAVATDPVSLVPVAGGATFPGALGLKHAADGSGRLFVVEQGGQVRVIEPDGTVRAAPYAELGARTSASGERGLLDIAFHPDFASNGRFYLHYTAGSQRPPGTEFGDTVVAEFSAPAEPGGMATAPERIVLTVTQDFANHNGGQMRFGPDGYLWIGLGDGGSANDPCNRARTLDPDQIVTGPTGGVTCKDHPSVALLGKMLRIDVDQMTPDGDNNLCAANPEGSAEYAVPPGNPFSEDADRCGEVWAYGLRNPWRWSFDRETGDLWIADVGQNTWEEVNLAPWSPDGGLDYGWKECEGSFKRGSTTEVCALPDSVLPVLEYRTRDPQVSPQNCSVTGGYRYRGPVGGLLGAYIFGDFCSGRIWLGRETEGQWQAEEFSTEGSGLRSFGEDEEGNVYVVRAGRIWRFADEVVFADGFETH